MNQHTTTAGKIWWVIYPVFMYYVIMIVTMFCAQLIFGRGDKMYMLCKIIASLVTLVVISRYYRADVALRGELGSFWNACKVQAVPLLLALGIMAFLSIGVNNVLAMSGLMEWSDSFQDASDGFFGGNLVIQILSAVVVTPVLEEMLHRGVVFGRVKELLGAKGAILISALIFAALHFNIVQFIYALLLGFILAGVKEKTGKLIYPILCHALANGIAVLRTATGVLERTASGDLWAWVMTLGILAVGVLLTLWAKRRHS
ncbi:MAG: CPBP family intramembrane metalloprotease [Agathobacter sp.]|nr:CPBP family intramembrane metalloprotease [Agathobacter sp.]